MLFLIGFAAADSSALISVDNRWDPAVSSAPPQIQGGPNQRRPHDFPTCSCRTDNMNRAGTMSIRSWSAQRGDQKAQSTTGGCCLTQAKPAPVHSVAKIPCPPADFVVAIAESSWVGSAHDANCRGPGHLVKTRGWSEPNTTDHARTARVARQVTPRFPAPTAGAGPRSARGPRSPRPEMEHAWTRRWLTRNRGGGLGLGRGPPWQRVNLIGQLSTFFAWLISGYL
jgi:hypothetical protein